MTLVVRAHGGASSNGRNPRVVKMGYNPRANPTDHGFGSGWVEKKLQISIWVKNEPNSLRTRLIRVELVIARLAHQPANKF